MSNYIPLTPGVPKKVRYTLTNMQLKALLS